jgi:hypothetical protein
MTKIQGYRRALLTKLETGHADTPTRRYADTPSRRYVLLFPWLAFSEFPMDFAVLQSERRVERAAFFRDESFENVALTFDEHFAHLVRRNFALQDRFAHFKPALLFRNILAHVKGANVVDLAGTTDLTESERSVLCRIDHYLSAVAVVFKRELRLVLLIQDQRSGERSARLAAAEAFQWAHFPFSKQCGCFFRA